MKPFKNIIVDHIDDLILNKKTYNIYNSLLVLVDYYYKVPRYLLIIDIINT